MLTSAFVAFQLSDQLTRYYRNKKIVVTEWHEQRDAIFDAFLSASWPLACAGDKCSSCQKLSDLFFLCEDCGPQYVECMSCSNASHDMRPLHFRRLWNGHKYIQADGVVVIETQHNSTCTSRILRLMDIYDCKGRHHKVKMRFCNCEKRAATLLKHGLWPARPVSPNAAYHIDFLMETMDNYPSSVPGQAGAFKRKSVRFSYKKLDDGDIRVVGLPEGVALKRPASLSSATIRKILSMSHLLHVEEVPKYPPPSASSTAITVPLLNADSNAHSITLPNDSELSVSLIHGNTIPPGQNVSQSVEPPSQNVSQSVEPLSQNVSQSVEPPSQNVSQSVEPPSTSKKIRRKRKENPTLQSGMKVQQLYRIHTESGTSTAWYHGCIKRVVKGDVSIRFDGEEAITKSKLSDIKAAMAEGTFLICK
ncbi:hypothetical protein CAPTEDRAFT_192830 [Capitella teleta]|uniref:CxC1-like cysteine cluster associated with KDZ transposases domain-containing protein n=1 Tax=Capitella teleta TaxID=283909 RepID=R7UTR5_CAPTE|nr:hypothetical protein CAPTEDRAFT_192830 [Capitella teleta]|eukprot:ELU07322.1 hypothetical protein CAPTEDRAFT_192830 [Capitella teleta]